VARLVALEADAPLRWQRRLAALGPSACAAAAETLRLSRADAALAAVLARELASDRGPAELGYRHGAWVAADVVLARAARADTQPPAGWREAIGRGAGAEFPVRAADLMPALRGPALGARLKALEARWIASDFALDRDALLQG
jgi:poly(A) polymerase